MVHFLLKDSVGYLEFSEQGTPPQMWQITQTVKLMVCPLYLASDDQP